MNIQEYIESGVLELYAAGGLTPHQSAEVEQVAAQHPEVRAALDTCLRAMEAYALTYASAPRPELEDRILKQLQAASAVRQEETAPAGKVFPLDTFASAVPQANTSNRWWQIAAVVVLLISVASNVYLYTSLQETREELFSSRQNARQYALQVNRLEQQNVQSESLLGVLRNPQTLAVQLKGVAQHPQAQAIVFWNQGTKEVYFDPSGLPAAPAGKQYQLWALVNGKPVDAGVVTSTDSSLLRLKTVAEAQAFAVTLEQEGGSPVPTLEEMYVMGESSAR
ncbi:anti-sigma factor [Rufibacter immobilis]|uniref:anti-sigma factor n=1 Tax=Rufibacter immobilis TaxID=1348778 RepID=UPI0035E51804